MRTRKPLSGPFSELPFYTQNEIEHLCVDELAKVNLLPDQPAPVRIDRFIEKRFGRPHQYADLPSGILGLTQFGPKGVQNIVLSEALESDTSKPNERRLRTTLAHEAGHGLLHAHLFVLSQNKPLFGDWSDNNKPKVLCRGEVTELAAKAKTEPWEYQANMVMGAILMPKRLTLVAIEPFLTANGGLGVTRLETGNRQRAIQALAEVFDVNPIVVRIRLSQLIPSENTGQLTL
ncbi:MAG: hypothetical protein JWM11_4417 [Planctomycetaceae bacterium]|nr:hypothetical protein [Planctomycetaceae bacterium]